MPWRSPEFWLVRADEARAMASKMHDPSTKLTMLSIAAQYEKLARHAALASELEMQADDSVATW